MIWDKCQWFFSISSLLFSNENEQILYAWKWMCFMATLPNVRWIIHCREEYTRIKLILCFCANPRWTKRVLKSLHVYLKIKNQILLVVFGQHAVSILLIFRSELCNILNYWQNHNAEKMNRWHVENDFSIICLCLVITVRINSRINSVRINLSFFMRTLFDFIESLQILLSPRIRSIFQLCALISLRAQHQDVFYGEMCTS